MINQLKSLFARLTLEEEKTPLLNFETALAALLVEVMRADGEIKDSELIKVESILLEKCEIAQNDVAQLIEIAREKVEHAIDLFAFVNVINEHTNDVERIDIIELLWHVSLADGDIDGQEDYIIRKISGLMYVAHADFIAAKLAAQSPT